MDSCPRVASFPRYDWRASGIVARHEREDIRAITLWWPRGTTRPPRGSGPLGGQEALGVVLHDRIGERAIEHVDQVASALIVIVRIVGGAARDDVETEDRGSAGEILAALVEGIADDAAFAESLVVHPNEVPGVALRHLLPHVA